MVRRAGRSVRLADSVPASPCPGRTSPVTCPSFEHSTPSHPPLHGLSPCQLAAMAGGNPTPWRNPSSAVVSLLQGSPGASEQKPLRA